MIFHRSYNIQNLRCNFLLVECLFILLVYKFIHPGSVTKQQIDVSNIKKLDVDWIPDFFPIKRIKYQDKKRKGGVEWLTVMVENKRLPDGRGTVEVGFKAEKLLNGNRGIPRA